MGEAAEAGGCLFCRIATGEIPSKKIYEDESTFAFLDINPRNPGHVLVIPKRHALTLLDMSEKDVGRLFGSSRLRSRKAQSRTASLWCSRTARRPGRS